MTENDIYKLHQKYSAGEHQKELLDLIWTHSKIVEEISCLIVDSLEKKYIKVDKELVKQGTLVHDIGCYDCNFLREKGNPYIKHGEIGYEILIKEGLTESMARFALIHMGVGLTKENILKNSLPLKLEDYIPITLEEEIVAYADNFHSKGKPCFWDFNTVKISLNNFHESSEPIFERFRKKFGEPDLKKIEEKYNEWQEKTREWINSIK